MRQAHARHLVELGYLEGILNSMGFSTQLVERSPHVPYHTLLVGLEPDARGRPMQVALTFYPVEEEDIGNALFLQYFIDLPFEVDKERLADVGQLLPDVNNQVVLGHFGITAGQDRLHYRYVQALPADRTVTAEGIEAVIVMVSYTPSVFKGILGDLAEGEISVEQARAKLQAQYAEM